MTAPADLLLSRHAGHSEILSNNWSTNCHLCIESLARAAGSFGQRRAAVSAASVQRVQGGLYMHVHACVRARPTVRRDAAVLVGTPFPSWTKVDHI